MASAPPEPPETLVVASFSGIKNTVSRERLAKGELEAAVNVDIDDVGQLRRRRGFVQRSNAVCHSITTLAGRTFMVKDGVLGLLFPDCSFNPIVPVGSEALCYTVVGDDVYYSNSVASGRITSDGIPATWGDLIDNQWVSPVIRPTETLGAIRGKLLGGPPKATSMESYKGRIYLGHERLIWATELYQYNLVDKTRNFMKFEADVTMIAAVDDGLYVGTTASLLFLQGLFSSGMKLTTILQTGVVPGSCVMVPYAKSVPQARQGPVPEGFGPMFMTEAGITVGMNGGAAFNLTQDHVVFPGAVRAAALYREDSGANTYVAVADSAGGPVANARIGDYVDAEIIRASQRG